MVLSSESTLVPETPNPSLDIPRGTTPQSRVYGVQNPDKGDEDDPVLKAPGIILGDKWNSSLQVGPQSMSKSESFQVAFIYMAARSSHSFDPEASRVLPLR